MTKLWEREEEAGETRKVGVSVSSGWGRKGREMRSLTGKGLER